MKSPLNGATSDFKDATASSLLRSDLGVFLVFLTCLPPSYEGFNANYALLAIFGLLLKC